MIAQPVSVSKLIYDIKNILEGEFRETYVLGEISNLSGSGAGHWYFTLSDANSSISCACFKMDAMRNPIIRSLKNGDKIKIWGPISLYTKRGTFQILAKRIEKEGKGDLKEQFEKLKIKLQTQGCFDLEKKKTIPRLPKKVAVITALGAAALQDFLNVTLRRSFQCHIVIVPALVQGDAAPISIISALTKVEKAGDFDLVVLTRGGGSMEDLWAFNNEDLVYKLDQLAIPVISAIGHQVDFTLSDYVSDLRCETPTAAAEIISQNQIDFQNKLDTLQVKLKNSLIQDLLVAKDRLANFHPLKLAGSLAGKVSSMHRKLASLDLRNRDYKLIPIHQHQMALDDYLERMKKIIERKRERISQKIDRNFSMLNTLNPKSILNRGYSIINLNNKVVGNLKEFNSLSETDVMKISFSDGDGYAKKTTK
jgi:exodeoxyribonuclease VII large subunit